MELPTPSSSEQPGRSGSSTQAQPLVRVLQAFAIAVVLGLLGLLVWDLSASSRGTDLVNAIQAGKRPLAPAFTLPVIWTDASTWSVADRRLLTQPKLALGQLRGQPIVLNFWASWCVPCKQEAPRLAEAAQTHAGRVVFLGVDVQDLTSTAHEFLRKYLVRYGSVRDPGGSTYAGYGLTGVPETFWINRWGRIVAHVAGPVSVAQLDQGIALAESSR